MDQDTIIQELIELRKRQDRLHELLLDPRMGDVRATPADAYYESPDVSYSHSDVGDPMVLGARHVQEPLLQQQGAQPQGMAGYRRDDGVYPNSDRYDTGKSINSPANVPSELSVADANTGVSDTMLFGRLDKQKFAPGGPRAGVSTFYGFSPTFVNVLRIWGIGLPKSTPVAIRWGYPLTLILYYTWWTFGNLQIFMYDVNNFNANNGDDPFGSAEQSAKAVIFLVAYASLWRYLASGCLDRLLNECALSVPELRMVRRKFVASGLGAICLFGFNTFTVGMYWQQDYFPHIPSVPKTVTDSWDGSKRRSVFITMQVIAGLLMAPVVCMIPMTVLMTQLLRVRFKRLQYTLLKTQPVRLARAIWEHSSAAYTVKANARYVGGTCVFLIIYTMVLVFERLMNLMDRFKTYSTLAYVINLLIIFTLTAGIFKVISDVSSDAKAIDRTSGLLTFESVSARIAWMQHLATNPATFRIFSIAITRARCANILYLAINITAIVFVRIIV